MSDFCAIVVFGIDVGYGLRCERRTIVKRYISWSKNCYIILEIYKN